HHLLHARERVLARGEEIRNDAGDHAAMIEHGGCDRAHQAERAAAIDQADCVLGENLAERAGGFHEVGVGARTGAAIDADRPDLVQINLVHSGLCGPATWRRQVVLIRRWAESTRKWRPKREAIATL